VTRRGTILLEVLLAIAVFAFAGVVVLGVLQETVASAGRADRRAIAMDLARSRLAEIEAGLGPEGADEASADAPSAIDGLRIEERLEPSDFDGLQLAVVEVWDDAAPAPSALAQAVGGDSGGSGGGAPRLAVLRQLVRAAGVPSAGTRPEFNR
jgi:type II secretory pathway pseudopilin PulG